MEQYNDDHYFTRAQKIYFLICGIIIALTMAYVTHIWFEYRLVSAEWDRTFESPETFWIIEKKV
jgi:hypothetical protein